MRKMVFVSVKYLTSNDNTVAFKRIANSPDCMISFWSVSWTACDENSAWEEIQLAHMIVVTTKELKCKNLASLNFQMKYFVVLQRNFKPSWQKRFCFLRFTEFMMK